MPLAFNFDDSEVLFRHRSLPSCVWSPEPQFFRQFSGFPESLIGVMRPSSYEAISNTPPDMAFYTSCKDSIALPVQSDTCQRLFAPSCSEPVSRLNINTFTSVDTFILTDVQIIVYEADLQQGATRNAYLAEDFTGFIALCISGSYVQRGYQEIQKRVVYLAGFKRDLKGNFSLLGNLRIGQNSRRGFARSIHWSSLLSTLIASYYASTVTLQTPVIVIGLDCHFRTSFRRNLMCFHPSSSQAKSIFSFLRYYGPRLLRGARRILLDEDGFQITHIGQGAFAVISRVWHRLSGEVRVMKRITFDKTGLAEYLARNEIETLEAMKGNIWFPPLLNHFKEGGEFVVTMPFYRRGDLAGLIEHKGFLGREIAQFYSAQLVLAIQSLHKVGIVHRDIKPDNIFLDEQGHLVLADLGLAENIATFEGGEDMMARFPAWVDARTKGGDEFPFLWVGGHNPLGTRGIAGTFWYTAPEVFRYERYSFGVDYWSVGLIYHELVTGHIPFNHYRPYPQSKRPLIDFRIKPGQLKDVALWEQRALRQMLHPIPEERFQTVTEIKKSRLFYGVLEEDGTPGDTSAFPTPTFVGRLNRTWIVPRLGLDGSSGFINALQPQWLFFRDVIWIVLATLAVRLGFWFKRADQEETVPASNLILHWH